MIVILSGEGPSDLGQCNNQQSQCSAAEFIPGPMAVLVDQLLSARLNYSPLQLTPECCLFYPEQALEQKTQARKQEKKRTSLTGKKRPEQETGYFYINAWMLGEIAKDVEFERGDVSIAVLFRDCDGTHSAKADIYDRKWQSMIDGFNRATYHRGVPMLPKPKSEAWLLCAAQATPYVHCSALEDLPGNDVSPHSAKMQLLEAREGRVSAEELRTWLETCPYDFDRATKQLPSLARFVARLQSVLTNLA